MKKIVLIVVVLLGMTSVLAASNIYWYFDTTNYAWFNGTTQTIHSLNLSCSSITGASYDVCAGDGAGAGSYDLNLTVYGSTTAIGENDILYVSGVGGIETKLSSNNLTINASLTDTTIEGQSNKTIVAWQNISNLPVCVAGDFLQYDGTLQCSTPTGGAGAGDKWVDDGTVISPNSTFASNINATLYTASFGTNISNQWVNTSFIVANNITSTNWDNVSITESQVSDLFHTVDTNCTASNSCGDILYSNNQTDIILTSVTQTTYKTGNNTEEIFNAVANNTYLLISDNVGNTTLQMQNAINSSTFFYNIYTADLICTDCLSGTEISELTDADVSNTLTCSDLQAGSEVVADTEVEDDITIVSTKNGNFTQNLTIGNMVIWYNGTHTCFGSC